MKEKKFSFGINTVYYEKRFKKKRLAKQVDRIETPLQAMECLVQERVNVATSWRELREKIVENSLLFELLEAI